MVMPTSRGWLKVHGYMTVVCAAFTLVLGLDIWFDTLRSRSRLAGVWALQPASSQSLLQQDVSVATVSHVFSCILLPLAHGLTFRSSAAVVT